jgi:hypothetical protein
MEHFQRVTHMSTRGKSKMVFLIAIVGVFLTSYGASAGGSTDTCPAKAEQFKLAAKKEFIVGDNDASIQRFMKRHQISFSFDRFAKRYQGITRDIGNQPKSGCAVAAYIYADDAGNYLSAEFMATYTGL